MSTSGHTAFGELLKRYRQDAWLTQEALAERAGVSPRSIRALERGESKPQHDTAQRLAGALRLASDEREQFLTAAAPAPRRTTRRAGVPAGIAAVLPVQPTLADDTRKDGESIATNSASYP